MNRLIKTILLLFLLYGSAVATVTQIDSIENIVSNTYIGGTIFKVGVASDFYGILYSGTSPNELLICASFSCTSSGELSETVISNQGYATGTGTLGGYPGAIQIPATEYFIGSFSHDATGSNDSTWVFIFTVDTSDATVGGVIAEEVIKYAPTRENTIIQVGESDYYMLSYRRIGSSTCGIKTFAIDKVTPAVGDVTIDSISTISAYSIDIDRVGDSDFYVISNWYSTFSVSTREISQVDGTIGAQIDNAVIFSEVQLQNSKFNTYPVNDSIFVAITCGLSLSDPRNFCTFKVSPTDGSITISDTIDITTKFEESTVAANDSGIIAFYSGYYTGYDGYTTAYSIDQEDGSILDRQQKETQWSQNLTTAFYPSSLMLGDDSRYVLLAYRGADTYGWLRTLLLEPNLYWGHERDGVSYPDISDVDGVDIPNVLEVDGVEK